MAEELLTPGKGKFRIKKVKTHEERVNEHGELILDYLQTKKGDRKVMVVVEATDSKGQKGTVFEHLTMNAAWKVNVICQACDLPYLFESDATCLDKLDDLVGAVGECIIGISEADGQWPEKTIISKYIVPKSAKKVNPSVVDAFFADPIPDDSIPF